MSLSVIVPTVGRPTLANTLLSIVSQMDPTDELLVERNDEPWGNAARQRMMQKATGDFLLFMDDDDVYLPDAFQIVRTCVATDPDAVHIFKMAYPDGRVLWQEPQVQVGNVSTQMFVVPNQPDLLGMWGDRYEGDYDFLSSTLAHHRLAQRPGPVWHDVVIALLNPQEAS